MGTAEGAQAALISRELAVIGQQVRVVFKPSEGGHAVPMFTPA